MTRLAASLLVLLCAALTSQALAQSSPANRRPGFGIAPSAPASAPVAIFRAPVTAATVFPITVPARGASSYRAGLHLSVNAYAPPYRVGSGEWQPEGSALPATPNAAWPWARIGVADLVADARRRHTTE